MRRTLCLLLALLFIFSLGLQALADDVLFCRICGRQIPVDSKVCPYCGEEVVHVGSGTETKNPPAAQIAAPTGPFFTQKLYAEGPDGVRVTKSPYTESVPYGGSCMFIAHADNAVSVTWYLANSDFSAISKASDAAQNVSGLSVSGANTDTLHLSGIPSWMNGCYVQAVFTGEGGPVYTETARIWTYEETKAQPACYPWWWFWWWCRDPYACHKPDRPDKPDIDYSFLTDSLFPDPPDSEDLPEFILSHAEDEAG